MDWTMAALIGAAALAIGALAWIALRRRRAEPPARGLEPAAAPRPMVEGDLVLPVAGGETARIHYASGGAAGSLRPPVTLIHGLGGSIRHFTATLFEELAQDHAVTAFDRPGYGLSTRPRVGAAQLREQAALLRAAHARLGVERPVLVGHSFGGAVALAYALDYPDEIAGLALLAPAAFPFRMKPPLPDETVDSPAARRAIAWTIGPLLARKNAETTLAAAFGPQSPPADYDTVGGGAFARRPAQLEAMMEDGALLRPELAEMAPRYARLAAPVAMLFGTSDGVLTFEDHGPPLRRAAAHVALTTLDGVGHMLPFAAPAACLELIRSVTGSQAAARRAAAPAAE